MLMNASLRWLVLFFYHFTLPRALFVLCAEVGRCLPLFRVCWQDMSKQPPTQELVAKDLHGNEWRFRHIFRGDYLILTADLVF